MLLSLVSPDDRDAKDRKRDTGSGDDDEDGKKSSRYCAGPDDSDPPDERM